MEPNCYFKPRPPNISARLFTLKDFSGVSYFYCKENVSRLFYAFFLLAMRGSVENLEVKEPGENRSPVLSFLLHLRLFVLFTFLLRLLPPAPFLLLLLARFFPRLLFGSRHVYDANKPIIDQRSSLVNKATDKRALSWSPPLRFRGLVAMATGSSFAAWTHGACRACGKRRVCALPCSRSLFPGARAPCE